MIEHKTAEEAIEANIKAIGDGHIEFEGMNCNDWLNDDEPECEGWDGTSRRCDCGNRRVSWEASQDSKGNWSAYGVAY
jgi:hypothetical protein